MSTDQIAEVSSRSNDVYVTGSMIVDVTYVSDSLRISDGQPSCQPPMITPYKSFWPWDPPGFKITLQAGRQKTTPVAEKFNVSCGGRDHQYSPGAFHDKSPSELNFFFSVLVQIQGVRPALPVYLGQGSEITNNWWIGGDPVESTRSSGKFVVIANGEILRLNLSGSGERLTFTY
jgi:hypothetical protein